jgi:hypothetical protein
MTTPALHRCRGRIPTTPADTTIITQLIATSIFLASGLINAMPFLIMILSVIPVKIASTIVVVLADPLKALEAVPRNWYKVVICTDVLTTPEILPGIESVDDNYRHLSFLKLTNFGSVLPQLQLGGAKSYFMLWGIIPALAAIYCAAIAYRISLKSTALIWSPLIWVAGGVRQVTDLQRFLQHIINLSLYRISRIYSAFVLLVFAAKIYLFISLEHLGSFFILFQAGTYFDSIFCPMRYRHGTLLPPLMHSLRG